MGSAATAPPVVVVGAGIGGLVAAVELAAAGIPVTLLEAADAVGGKAAALGGPQGRLDGGPTVLTMAWVFEQIFAAAGADFAATCRPQPLPLLARHLWPDGSTLDLPAGPEAAADAVGALCGAAAARGTRAFLAYAQRLYDTALQPFILAPRPSLGTALRRGGMAGLWRLGRIDAGRSMHRALAEHFDDPRLLQLFGRYATYCGGSPYATPATFNLVAAVEQQGVWRLPGGMQALADALWALARRHGATLHLGRAVRRLRLRHGAVCGVALADGEVLAARAVVLNGGAAAAAALLAGDGDGDGNAPAPAAAAAAAPVALSARVLSCTAAIGGAPLAHHTVLFGPSAAAEFAALFGRRAVPAAGTAYLCAADRGAATDGRTADPSPAAAERLMCLVNAPTGAAEDPRWPDDLLARLAAQFDVHVRPTAPPLLQTPTSFARRYPGSHGALYGSPPHALKMLLTRPGSHGPRPGLYLCGGSVHPGPGLPMAALSGRLAAAALRQDSRSTSRWRRAATPGGTSTSPPPTAAAP